MLDGGLSGQAASPVSDAPPAAGWLAPAEEVQLGMSERQPQKRHAWWRTNEGFLLWRVGPVLVVTTLLVTLPPPWSTPGSWGLLRWLWASVAVLLGALLIAKGPWSIPLGWVIVRPDSHPRSDMVTCVVVRGGLFGTVPPALFALPAPQTTLHLAYAALTPGPAAVRGLLRAVASARDSDGEILLFVCMGLAQFGRVRSSPFYQWGNVLLYPPQDR